MTIWHYFINSVKFKVSSFQIFILTLTVTVELFWNLPLVQNPVNNHKKFSLTQNQHVPACGKDFLLSVRREELQGGSRSGGEGQIKVDTGWIVARFPPLHQSVFSSHGQHFYLN